MHAPLRTYKDENDLIGTTGELAIIEKVRAEFKAAWKRRSIGQSRANARPEVRQRHREAAIAARQKD